MPHLYSPLLRSLPFANPQALSHQHSIAIAASYLDDTQAGPPSMCVCVCVCVCVCIYIYIYIECMRRAYSCSILRNADEMPFKECVLLHDRLARLYNDQFNVNLTMLMCLDGVLLREHQHDLLRAVEA